MLQIEIKNKQIWEKSKIKLMNLVLCSSLLTGCSIQTNNYSTDSLSLKNSPISTQNTTSTPMSSKEEEFDIDIDDILFTKSFQFSSDENKSIQEEIDKIEVEYLHSELFQIEKALKEYQKIITNSTEKISENYQLDFQEVYSNILRNNAKYFQVPSYNYQEMDSDLLKKVVQILVNDANLRLSQSEFIDISQIKQTFKDLKVCSYSGFGAGAIDENNTIFSIDLNTISNYQERYPDLDVLEMVVKHETNHLMQAMTGKAFEGKNYDKNYGFCYSFPDLEVNSLYYTYLFEAAAEKLMLNDYADGRKPLFYENQVMSLEALTLATFLGEQGSPTAVEELTQQHRLEKFLELFHISSEKEKYEILNMLYAYQFIEMESNDFKDYFEKINGNRMTYDEIDQYKISLKGSIALTLTKQFYSHLLSKISNQKVTLEELYTLLSIFEDELSRITWYSSRSDYYPDFLSQYEQIQSLLFEKIATVTDMEKEQLLESFYSFHSKVNQYQNISFLTEQENSFLEHMMESRLNQRRESISYLVEEKREILK